jgi:hypothetical protein
VGREGLLQLTLDVHERLALQFLVTELLDADEPEAVLAVLRHIAGRMAHRALKRQDVEACERWSKMETALNQTLDNRD